MSLAAVLVVNWSTPGDMVKLARSYMEYETLRVPWFVHQNEHPNVDPDVLLRDLRAVLDVPVELSRSPNLGHGFGINRAAGAADAGFYFLLNPDCVFTGPVMGELIDFLGLRGERFAVGPKQMNSRRQITAGGFVGPMEDPKLRYWKVSDVANRVARDVVEGVPLVSGSAMMVKADAFHELGGMLETKHYYSETWLCYHANIHGYTCTYYGRAWMIHEWHQSTPIGSPFSDGTMREDQAMFRAKCDEHDPPIPRD